VLVREHDLPVFLVVEQVARHQPVRGAVKFCPFSTFCFYSMFHSAQYLSGKALILTSGRGRAPPLPGRGGPCGRPALKTENLRESRTRTQLPYNKSEKEKREKRKRQPKKARTAFGENFFNDMYIIYIMAGRMSRPPQKIIFLNRAEYYIIDAQLNIAAAGARLIAPLQYNNINHITKE
jgi:hypothetical protein